MSRLVLSRIKHDANATQGELTLDGVRLCYTLENRPPRDEGVKEPGLSRIPAGTWPLQLRTEGGFHTRYASMFGAAHHGMVEILIPGWKYVLFHIGNYHSDTDGCVLLGSELGTSPAKGLCVWRSRDAYREVYPRLLEAVRNGASLVIEDEGECRA
jgi:hypothetical protein